MKTSFEILRPGIIYFRNWNEFSNKKFRTQLLTKLFMGHFNNSSNDINKVLKICINTTDIFVPHKKHSLQRNNKPSTWDHRKQSCLRSNCLENRTEANSKFSYNLPVITSNAISALIFWEKTKQKIIHKFKRKRCDR